MWVMVGRPSTGEPCTSSERVLDGPDRVMITVGGRTSPSPARRAPFVEAQAAVERSGMVCGTLVCKWTPVEPAVASCSISRSISRRPNPPPCASGSRSMCRCDGNSATSSASADRRVMDQVDQLRIERAGGEHTEPVPLAQRRPDVPFARRLERSTVERPEHVPDRRRITVGDHGRRGPAPAPGTAAARCARASGSSSIPVASPPAAPVCRQTRIRAASSPGA